MKKQTFLSILLMLLIASSAFAQVSFVKHTAQANYTSAGIIKVANLDLANGVDVIAYENANGANRLVWFTNDNNFGYSRSSIFDEFVGIADFEIANIDGDTTSNDIICISSVADSSVVAFINNGSESFTPQILATDLIDPIDIAVFDYQDDGDLDFVVADKSTDLMNLYINNGDLSNLTKVIFGGDIDEPIQVEPTDLNGDGHNDFIVTSYSSQEIGYYINDGAHGFTYTRVSNTSASRKTIATDIDGDNDMDIIISDYNNGNILLVANTGSLTFSPPSIILSNTAGLRDFQFGDLDGDITNLDVVVANDNDNNNEWYNIVGDTIDAYPYDTISTQSVFLADMNNDTRVDIITLDISGEILIYENDTNFTKPRLISPNDGVVDYSIFPELTWAKVHGAEDYIIELDTNNAFTDPFKEANISENEYMYLENDFLLELTEYFWRVKAYDDTDTSEWSDAMSFTTEDFEVGELVIHQLPDSIELSSLKPRFTWDRLWPVDDFQLIVSANLDLSTPAFDSVLTDTTYTLTDSLDPATTYFWKLIALCPLDTVESAILSFKTKAVEYAAPNLVIPLDGDTLENILVADLVWSKIYGADKYHLQLCDTSDFVVNLIDTIITEKDFYVADGILSEDAFYFWRVRSMNSVETDTSAWAIAYSFYAPTLEISVPVLLSPAHADTDLPTNPTLIWRKANIATGYHFRFWKNGSTPPQDGLSVSDTTYTLSYLDRNTDYSWQVRAFNDTDTSEWATPFLFKTRLLDIVSVIDGYFPTKIAVGMLDSDTRPDIAIAADTMNGSWLKAENSGDFTLTNIIGIDSANHVQVRDINDDDIDDILFSSTEKGYVRLLYSNAESTPTVVSDTADAVLKAEIFNEVDGSLPDILYYSAIATPKFVICKYDPVAKTYSETDIPHISDTITHFNIGHYNADDKLDIAYNSINENELIVLWQTPDGEFKKHKTGIVCDTLNDMETADFNDDGHNDFVFSSTDKEVIHIIYNNGDSTFTPRTVILDNAATKEISDIVAIDYDNDGDNDIIAACAATDEVIFYEYTSYDVYTERALSTRLSKPSTMTVMDMNGDGSKDIILGSETAGEIIIIENHPLELANLVFPANNEDGIYLGVAFEWDPVARNTSYEIQISTLNDFSDIDSMVIVTTFDNGYNVEEDLKYGTVYYWRVRASDGVNFAPWSNINNFTTLPADLAAVNLIYPADDAIEIELTDTLVWHPVIGAENYDLEITYINEYGNPSNMSIKNLTDTTYVIDLEYHTEYIWKVRAISDIDDGDWSVEWSFTTKYEAFQRDVFLNKGWNTLGLTIMPFENDMDEIFGNIPEVLLVQDKDLNTYLPGNANNIGLWEYDKSYNVFVINDVQFTIDGYKPEDLNEYEILPDVNFINYCFDTSRKIEEAFAEADSNIAFVYNGAGELYFPKYNVDCIGMMNPEEGYKLYASGPTTFSYIPEEVSVTVPDVPNQDPVVYIKSNLANVLNYSFIIVDTEADVTDEIVAFDATGLIIGSGSVSNGKSVITIYEDNSNTTEKDGATVGEKITLRSYVPSTMAFNELEQENVFDAVTDEAYTQLYFRTNHVFYFEGKAVAVEEDNNLDEMLIYPMPIENTANLRLEMKATSKANVAIFDLDGRFIKQMFNGAVFAGTNNIDLNCTDITAGAYLIAVETDKGMSIQKIIIK